MEPIRIVHFADYHLGIDTRGPVDPETRLNGRVLDFLDSLDALIDYAVEYDADIAVFAGDAYHKHSPDPTYMREFGERIIRLSEHCPVVLVVGNHDMPGVIERASAIDIFSTLQVPNVYVGWDFVTELIQTKRGAIQVTTFPYPFKQLFLKPGESKDLFKPRVSKRLKELAAKLDDDYPAIIVGHFSVTNAQYGSERAMIIGDDAQVDIEDLLAWDYAALGHIHYHQNLTEGIEDAPPIVYAGSMERVDFGEENQDKGFIWVEIGDDVKWEMIEVDARPFVTIHTDVTETNRPTNRILKKIERYDERGLLKGAVVRLKIDLLEHQHPSVNQSAIYSALNKGGVYYVHALSFNIQRNVRELRLKPEEEGVPLSSLAPLRLLEAYFEQQDKSSREVNELMKLAKDIFAEDS